MQLLERLATAVIHERLVQHLVDGGAAPDVATATADHAAAGGVAGILQWIVANAPAIYGFARMIALMFGIVLPPIALTPPPTHVT